MTDKLIRHLKRQDVLGAARRAALRGDDAALRGLVLRYTGHALDAGALWALRAEFTRQEV